MKLTRLIAAVALAAPVAQVANAGVNITPFAGYHHAGKAWDEQRDEVGYAKKNGMAKGISIGAEMTPSVALELEYLNASDDVREIGGGDSANEVDQENASINLLVNADLITQNYDSPWKPYVLLGLGMESYDVKPKSSSSKLTSDDFFITNFGVGTKYRFSDYIALRSELRGIYNPRANWLEGLATVGLQATLGGHLKPYIPAPPVFDEVVEEPKPVVVKQPKDSDRDGVIDARDRCPNTARGTRVDTVGCPVPVKIDLNIFFDKSKAAIKPQYRAEVARAARILKQNPRAIAVVEGHASKSGSASYNQRLSAKRANAVRQMLVTQYGVNPGRISSRGFGYANPAYQPPSNPQNQRVLIRLK